MFAWASSLFFVVVFVLLPWAILVGGFTVLLRAQRGRPEGFASVTARSLIASALATLAFNVWAVVAIFGSSSSTAAVGFAFLPLYSFAVAAASWATAWSLLTLIGLARSDGPAQGPRAWAAGAAAALFLGALAAGGTLAWQRQSLLGAAAQADTPADRLTEIGERALAESDYEVLGKLASNPGAAPELVAKLTEFCENELGGARPVFCYSILYGLAAHPAAPAELLARLAVNPEVSIRTVVARNPHTPAASVETLASDPEPSVRLWVAANPGLSRGSLERLAADPDEIVRRNAAAALGRAGHALE
jgi:hypothetical protein